MDTEDINALIEFLAQIQEDVTVPKNVRLKLDGAMKALQQQEGDIKIKANRALQQLDEISDDPNIPPYVRPQIWNVVSQLESV